MRQRITAFARGRDDLVSADNFHPDRYSQMLANRAEHCPSEMPPFPGVLTTSRLQNRYRYAVPSLAVFGNLNFNYSQADRVAYELQARTRA